jgi:hypothetical protein
MIREAQSLLLDTPQQIYALAGLSLNLRCTEVMERR